MDIASIQKRIEIMEKLKEEIRTAKEMLSGELENNPEYLELEEEVKQATAKKKRLKEEIQNSGPNQKLSADIKSNNEEIATLKEILSQELFQLYKENDTDEITDANGETRKIRFSASLASKKGQGRDGFGKYTPPQE